LWDAAKLHVIKEQNKKPVKTTTNTKLAVVDFRKLLIKSQGRISDIVIAKTRKRIVILSEKIPH
jgi:hypothetical protein